jgi:undecaprenyl-diphosphatase
MTLDERLPLFISLTSIPLALGSAYFSERAAEIIKTPLGVAAVFALTGTALGLCERMGRKNKGMFDWNWKDATLVGLIQAGAIFPGWDHLSSAILGALFLNYRREPAVKYAYFASAPILLGQSIRHLTEINFHSPVAAADLSWLSFGVAWIVSLLAGLLVIGGLMKHIQHKGMGQYVAYRWILSVGVALAFWLKST